MKQARFKEFSDDELYILKRAMIEAEKHIFEHCLNYNEDEQRILNDLLNESIDNIKERRNETD